MNRNKKRIVIFSLESIANAGDQMLGDTTEYLIKQCGEYEIKRVQVKPYYKELGGWYAVEALIGNAIKWMSLKLPISLESGFKMYNLAYHIQYGRYYKNIIKNADAVVYALGMLKYSTQNHSYVFECINEAANRYNVPILMSAMSIEKPDENDWRFRQVVKAVNLPCVKMITTRDGSGGLERLRQHYIHRDGIVTDFVGDPALWAPQCYNIQKEDQHSPARLGIGLIRTSIYETYKGGLSSEELYNVYKDLLLTVISSGKYDWSLFCNGMESDMHLGRRLLKDLNLPQDKLLKAPQTARELLKLVSGFDIVFGARMHACITSFSLGIPVAGLLWDNKLDFFSETMGIRDYFTEAENLSGKTILSKLQSASEHVIDIENRDKYKNKTLECIKEFLSII